jgi:hypothetical protein
MQSPPHESPRRNKHAELVAIVSTGSRACVRLACPDSVHAGERARPWRHRCPDARHIVRMISHPLYSVGANRRLRATRERTRHRSHSSWAMAPRPRRARRPMRSISGPCMQRIFCSTRCLAPTRGFTTDGQSASAFARRPVGGARATEVGRARQHKGGGYFGLTPCRNPSVRSRVTLGAVNNRERTGALLDWLAFSGLCSHPSGGITAPQQGEEQDGEPRAVLPRQIRHQSNPFAAS